jgi:RimJ/RimL family protein N-acetyltransferase
MTDDVRIPDLSVPAVSRQPALILRPWQAADIPALTAEMSRDYLMGGMWSSPDDRPFRTVRRGGTERSGPMGKRDAARWLASQDRGWHDGDRLCFAVLETDELGGCVLAGNVGLKNRDETGRIGERETAEIGYWTAMAARGRGVAPAAVRAMTHWVFDAFAGTSLRQIMLVHNVDNPASCRVAEKAGYPFHAFSPANPPHWFEDGHIHLCRAAADHGGAMACLLGGDAKTHDPAPLGDAAVADESELFEQVLWPGVQVGATLRVTVFDLLGVGLDQASASISYRGQRRGNSGPGHAFAAGTGTGEQAADPPVRQLAQALFIGLGVVDLRHLGRRPVLTPAQAATVTIDEHLADSAVPHVSQFGLAVARPGAVLGDALGMKTDAPAATPDTVVRLNQRGEVIPGIGREQTRRVRGLSRCHIPILLLPPWSGRVPSPDDR